MTDRIQRLSEVLFLGQDAETLRAGLAPEVSDLLSGLDVLRTDTPQDAEELERISALGLTPQTLDTGEAMIAAGDELLLGVRRLPLPTTQLEGAMPSWTSGLDVANRFGPLADRFGRDVWLDVFRVTRQLRIVRGTGGPTILSLPITQALATNSAAGQSVYSVPRGSLWLATDLFAPAPSGTFTGLRVASGELSFSTPVVVNGDEVVVPTGIDIRITLTLAPPPPPVWGGEIGGPGRDARDTVFEAPSRIEVDIRPGTAEITLLEGGKLTAFGAEVALVPAPGPARYLAEFNRLVLPMAAAPTSFAPTAVAAPAFALSGNALITAAGLALPAARIEPARLGTASGVGAYMLELGPGLSASMLEEAIPAPLDSTVLLLDERRLGLTAATAQSTDRTLSYAMGDTLGAARVELTRLDKAALRFFSEADGDEQVAGTASATLLPDLPRDVAGSRVPVKLDNATIVAQRYAEGMALMITGSTRAPHPPRSFQLANGLLQATEPRAASFIARIESDRAVEGLLLVDYGLARVIPTLPDPYASTAGLPREPAPPREQLISRLSFSPGAHELDFALPQTPPLELGAAFSPPAMTLASTSAPSAYDSGIAAPSDDDVPGDIFKLIGPAIAFERIPKLMLLDVSTGAGQFGIALRPDAGGEAQATLAANRVFSVKDMQLNADPRYLALITLPAVQWEPIVAVPPDPDDGASFPDAVVFLNSGVPTVFDLPGGAPLPMAPLPLYDRLVENGAAATPAPTSARFTLPFGMLAMADLSPPEIGRAGGALVGQTRPTTPELEGAPQLSLRGAVPDLRALPDPNAPPTGPTALPGFTVQLPAAVPVGGGGTGGISPLGTSVTGIFNGALGNGGSDPLVPVTRIDVTGAGESLFSKWINPSSANPRVNKAEFDVVVGRAAREVIEAASILLPYGVEVVRTVTIERKPDAIFGRSDSGWVAAGDGVYGIGLDAMQDIVTHPGIVRCIRDVENIRETGQRITAGGLEFMAVYFEGRLDIDGSGLVPVRRHLGYVQISTGRLTVDAYRELIDRAGPMGGPLDTVIRIGGGRHRMRISRVGIGAAGTEFAMAGWGGVILPAGGTWSALEAPDALSAPAPVPEDRGLPIIRHGHATMLNGHVTSAGNAPYRFSDPEDLLRETTPERDYGLLHSMDTQRVFYRRPRIERNAPNRIVSTEAPVIADPYVLASALGVFPDQDLAIPHETTNYALEIREDGSLFLDAKETFPANLGPRVMLSAAGVSSILDYTQSDVTYALDTAEPVPWRFELTKAVKILNTDGLGDLCTARGDFSGEAGRQLRLTRTSLALGDAVSTVKDMMTLFGDFDPGREPEVRMTNLKNITWTLNFPLIGDDGEPFVAGPVTLDDCKFSVGVASTKKSGIWEDQLVYRIGGTGLIDNGGGFFFVILVKFSIIISTKTGTTYVIKFGFGYGWKGEGLGLKLKGYFAISGIEIWGDVQGTGVSFLLKGSAKVPFIITVTFRVEGKFVRLIAEDNSPQRTAFDVAKLTVAIDISVFLVFSISFEKEEKCVRVLSGPLTKDQVPNVLV